MEFSNTPLTSGTTIGSTWSDPARVEIVERLESIEFIYKQKSLTSLGVYPPRPPEERVFKIIYSCKDGKWHKSEPIYGRIVPQTKETYVFDED